MAAEQMRDPALDRAIELAGGPAALARFITDYPDQEPITAQAICDWKKCPPKRVAAVEAASAVSRHELRGDIFGPPPSSATNAERTA